MRRELIWLVLCLAIVGPAAALSAGGTVDATIAADEQAAALNALEAARRAMLTASVHAVDVAAGNAPPPPTRRLFPITALAEPPAVVENVSTPPPKLLLRGLTVTDSVARAIFGVEDATVPYRTVGVGDTVDTYTVETIGRNSVTLRDSMGQAEIFQLRGVGEAPAN